MMESSLTCFTQTRIDFYGPLNQFPPKNHVEMFILHNQMLGGITRFYNPALKTSFVWSYGIIALKCPKCSNTWNKTIGKQVFWPPPSIDLKMLKNTDLQAGICFGEGHKTIEGLQKREIPQSGICPAPCVPFLFTVVFAWKCRLFCVCAHGQCHIYFV